jgi:hypothetical protein
MAAAIGHTPSSRPPEERAKSQFTITPELVKKLFPDFDGVNPANYGNAIDKAGHSRLAQAAMNGDAERVHVLLHYFGANPNAADERFGRTALMHAAMGRGDHSQAYDGIVEELLAAGADPRIEDKILGYDAMRYGSRLRSWKTQTLMREAASKLDSVVPGATSSKSSSGLDSDASSPPSSSAKSNL